MGTVLFQVVFCFVEVESFFYETFGGDNRDKGKKTKTIRNMRKVFFTIIMGTSFLTNSFWSYIKDDYQKSAFFGILSGLTFLVGLYFSTKKMKTKDPI